MKDIVTSLHKALDHNNCIAIQILTAVTTRVSSYKNYLMAYMKRWSWGEDNLSTAQMFFESDPDPFVQFKAGSGLLPRVHLDVVMFRACDDPGYRKGFTALFL